MKLIDAVYGHLPAFSAMGVASNTPGLPDLVNGAPGGLAGALTSVSENVMGGLDIKMGHQVVGRVKSNVVGGMDFQDAGGALQGRINDNILNGVNVHDSTGTLAGRLEHGVGGDVDYLDASGMSFGHAEGNVTGGLDYFSADGSLSGHANVGLDGAVDYSEMPGLNLDPGMIDTPDMTNLDLDFDLPDAVPLESLELPSLDIFGAGGGVDDLGLFDSLAEAGAGSWLTGGDASFGMDAFGEGGFELDGLADLLDFL